MPVSFSNGLIRLLGSLHLFFLKKQAFILLIFAMDVCHRREIFHPEWNYAITPRQTAYFFHSRFRTCANLKDQVSFSRPITVFSFTRYCYN
jgi:hypothetical protein